MGGIMGALRRRFLVVFQIERRWINPLITAAVLGPATLALDADAARAEQTQLTLSPKALEELHRSRLSRESIAQQSCPG
jgi:hypothetical protein